MKHHEDRVFYIVVAVTIISIIAVTYLIFQARSDQKQIESLLQERNALLQSLNMKNSELDVASATNNELGTRLSDLKLDLEDLTDDYRKEKNKNDNFEGQISDLAGTLGDLDKLAKIDEELLQKYSKVYFLNENFTPSRLKQIDDKYVQTGKGDEYFHANAIDHLEDMFKDAARDDINLKVVSAYRSFDEQTDLKGQYTQIYGTGANTFSADQGYSEHQLGTTLDLTVDSVGGTYASFAETKAYAWLEKNAYKHGFILSYPKDNGFYIFEPWHWRFVGTDLASDLRRKDKAFYDLDQRDLDKYLLGLFD